MNGILGQILGGVMAGSLGRGGRRRGGGNMVLNGLLIALAAKAAHSYFQQRGADRSFNPSGGAQGGGMMRGLDDMIGGVLGQRGGSGGGGLPGGLGGVLGGLGGAGALGALLNQLRDKGFGDQVDSWVKPGPNRLIAPEELEQALGTEEIDALAEETGVPRQALLQDLSQALPEAVDELTPEGNEPNDDDLTKYAGMA